MNNSLFLTTAALGLAVSPVLATDTINYQYDELGRLVAACHSDQSKETTFSFDAAGNRTAVVQASSCSGAAPANGLPVANDDASSGVYAVYSGVNVYVRANDSDPDGHTLTVTQASCISSGCTVSIQGGGTHIYVVGTTAGGKDLTYTISDGNGGTAVGSVYVGLFEEMCGEEWC